MTIRPATQQDVPTLAAMRVQQLIDEGDTPNDDLYPRLLPYFEQALADGSLLQLVCEEEGRLIATAAVIYYLFPPSFDDLAGVTGYVANVYTHPDYRHRGLATALLTRLKEDAKARGVSLLYLRTLDDRKPLYAKNGYRDAPEWMRTET